MDKVIIGALLVATSEFAATAALTGNVGLGAYLGGVQFGGLIALGDIGTAKWEGIVGPVGSEMGDGGGGTGIVLVPPPVQVEYLSGSESMVTAANQTTLAWTDMLQAARALSCALAQHQSAVEAGIKSHVALQRAATAYYAANLASSLKFCGDTFRYLGHELEQAGAWNVRITLQDVLALRDRIVAKGRFPDSEQSVAEQINATEEEIASALTEVKAATFADLPDEFSLAELCVMMSHAFQEFELSEYVPDWVEG